ncbi:MAG: hypothetical protein HYX90_05205, partial [Chloroflexi bacterium]|nr:hypothetical protein [Chloroflexota bacterium]
FHKAFLDVVKRHGRANEIELGVRYNLGSRRLLANIGRLPHMLSHGKLKIRPSNIENPRHVKGLMDRAQGLGSPMQ